MPGDVLVVQHNEVFAAVSPVDYVDIPVPGGPWTKAQLDSMYWGVVSLDTTPLAFVNFRIYEVRLVVAYELADPAVSVLCIEGGFQTVHNISGGIPECD
jgi:hypothetical protein